MVRMPIYNLEWQDPPAADEALKQGILVQLQNNPGKWARICKDRSQTALAQEWMKLGTEARAVRSNPGVAPPRYDIYARWPNSKPPTVPLAIREEAARKASPPDTPVRLAVANGRALKPAPAGGYLAQRAQRGTPAEGNPL